MVEVVLASELNGRPIREATRGERHAPRGVTVATEDTIGTMALSWHQGLPLMRYQDLEHRSPGPGFSWARHGDRHLRCLRCEVFDGWAFDDAAVESEA